MYVCQVKPIFVTTFKLEDCRTVKVKMAINEPVTDQYIPPSAHCFRTEFVPELNRPIFKVLVSNFDVDRRAARLIRCWTLTPHLIMIRDRNSLSKETWWIRCFTRSRIDVSWMSNWGSSHSPKIGSTLFRWLIGTTISLTRSDLSSSIKGPTRNHPRYFPRCWEVIRSTMYNNKIYLQLGTIQTIPQVVEEGR